MKQRTALTLSLFFFLFACSAFAGLEKGNTDRHHLRNAFKKKQYSFQGGPGIGSLQHPNGYDYLLYGNVTSEYPTVTTTVAADYGLTGYFGVGFFLNRFSSRIEVVDNTDPTNKNGFDYKSFTFLARGSYHAYMGRNLTWLDPFAAAGIGFHALHSSPFGDNNIFEPNKGGFAWSLMVGANIYIVQNIGIFLEGGYGVNLAEGGLILRF